MKLEVYGVRDEMNPKLHIYASSRGVKTFVEIKWPKMQPFPANLDVVDMSPVEMPEDDTY